MAIFEVPYLHGSPYHVVQVFEYIYWFYYGILWGAMLIPWYVNMVFIQCHDTVDIKVLLYHGKWYTKSKVLYKGYAKIRNACKEVSSET